MRLPFGILIAFCVGVSVLPVVADYHYVDVTSTNPVPPYTNTETPADNIQDAVDVADPGDVVVVGPGLYAVGAKVTPGASVSNRVVATNGVIIEGSFGPELTIIVGAGPQGDSAVRCVYMEGGAMRGFTLTNGHTRTTGDAAKDCSGGGAYLDAGYLENCIVVGNYAAESGGGVRGGALHQCTLINNTALDGGGMSGTTARNSLVSRNTALRNGGGVRAGELRNCTVSTNTAYNGGGTYETLAFNSVVYHNAATTNSNWISGAMLYSCSDPVPTGTGNVPGPPLFKSFPDDLHLKTGSPCVDSGDNGYTLGQADKDLEGSDRIMNDVVDMGAYESFFASVNGRVTLDYVGLDGVLVGDGIETNVTDPTGSYSLEGLSLGTYTLAAYKDGYVFTPAFYTVTLTNSGVFGLDFAAQRFSVVTAISCGGPAYTDANGVDYTADINFTGGTVVSTADPITNTLDESLFQDARREGSYSIPLTNGEYLLTLRLAEIEHENAGARVFDVIAGGQVVAEDVDIYALAGGSDLALDLAKRITVTNGVLDISFATGTGLVSAIAVAVDETGIMTGPMGAPMWWMRQHGLTNDTLEGEEMNDADDDGAKNWEEYFAGTNPTNSTSVFRVVEILPETVSGRMPISFQTVPDTEYRLMSTTDLVSRWIPCPYATTESGRPQTSVITASVDTTVLYVTPSNAIRFYLAKIDTPLTPPRDAVAYGGHFYKIFDGVISWYEAKLRCEDMGGYLACIETAGEQAFLAEQAEGRYMWLGGTDEGGSWEWINGSPWDYTSWAGGQPNNALGIEDYLEMFTGGNWNDAPNQTSDYDDLPIEIYWMPVGYICEWEP